MNALPQLPSRYALILDPTAIRKALRKVESLNLPRRECRPLDRYTGPKANVDLARFDAQIDQEGDLADDYADEFDAADDVQVQNASAQNDDWDDEPRH